MSPPLRCSLAAALILALLFASFWSYRNSDQSPDRTRADEIATLATPRASKANIVEAHSRAKQAPVRHTTRPLKHHIRQLVTALDRGYPARVTIDGEAPRTLLLQPRKSLADDFQITLGAGGESESEFSPQVIRTYGGRSLGRGGALGGWATISIVDNAIAAVIVEEDGGVLNIKTDPDTGELLTLHEDAEDLLGTCQHDLDAGTASVLSDMEPHTDEDWLAGPPAQIAAALDDPTVLNAGGVNPGNGRIDKYIEPLPLGQNYDLSLRDLLVLVVLDKNATGANTTNRLTVATSEYLARMANVAAVHEHQLGVRLLVQEIILTPNSAEFDDVPASLADFRSWIGSNRSRGTYLWNAAAKFGSTGTSGGVIGVAYVRALSGGSGVSVNNKGFSHALVAHEMGHNMGSNHSSGGIMNSSIITGSRTFFTDVSGGETAAKDIYDHTRTRIYGPATMRHPEEIPFARDDDRTTAVNTPHVFNPVSNDDNVVRNGTANTVVTLEEVSRVQPLDAGTVAISGSNEVTFTPAPGWQGMAFFSYSIRGDVGNGGRGWLHKGDAAVQVGNFNANSLNLTLAPGQVFSFRPSGSGDPSIGSQPQHAFVGTSRDDRKLIIIRVRESATGSESFTFSRDGTTSTVNLTYLPLAEYLTATPDVFFFEGSGGSIDFNPLVNDQGAGYLSPASINPAINGATRAITYYFRHQFTVADVAGLTSLNLELLRDDGAIVYLNGIELMRDNMPAGAVDFETLASGSAGGGDETTYFPFGGLSTAALVEGDNVLAVEVHQSSTTSSDLAFDLGLSAIRGGGNTQLVARNSTWRYLDDGSDQGDAWKAPGFDDGGNFTLVSFGPDSGNKFITTYFRRSFEVADASAITGLTLDVRRDDGVVVYLNGIEVARDNMAAGAVNHLTTADGTASDDGADFHEFTIPTTGLVDGTNVIAAEIHQGSGTSSDIVFDLRLDANTAGGTLSLVPSSARWRYLDNGSNQGSAWRATAFNDNGWDDGVAPLGYPQEGSVAWEQGPGLFGFGDDREATSLNDGFSNLSLLPGAFRIISADNIDPSKGSLDFSETRPFTINGSRVNVRTGLMSFTPANGATGVATIEYTAEDGAGNQATGTVSIILPLVTITEPDADSAIIDIQNGLLFEGVTFDGGAPPLSGTVSPTWSMQSGPAGGTVTFADRESELTTARFSAPGEYVIRFTGDDTGFATFQERRVRVVDSGEGGGLNSGLVGWWKLDETGGTIVADSSGNGLNGIRVGNPIGTDGIIGGAFEFDATNRYVNLVQRISSFAGLQQGSIATWFQTTTGSERAIFAAADAGDSDRDLRLYVDDGKLKYKVRGDIGSNESSIRSAEDVNDGQWHHAAITVDAAMNATLYLDGEVVSTGIRPFFAGVSDIDALRIGQTVHNGNFANPFRGKIDDLRVYARVLEQDEITDLASASQNHAPLISLPNTTPITGGAVFNTGLLSLAVDDDSQPVSPGQVTLAWQKIAGPGTVSFGNAAALATNATFSTPGPYTLQLSADDGEVTSVDEIDIVYTGAGSDVPVSLGIEDLLIHQNAPGSAIDLFAVFEDAQDSDTDLSFLILGNTNPALFADASISASNPKRLILNYAADVEGTSRLTIRATDTDRNSIDAVFFVTVANFQPTIASQVFTLPEDSEDGALVGTLSGIDLDGDPLSFAVLGGNTGGVFSINRNSGQIRVADSALLDFETAPGYALTVAVTDADHPSLDSTALISINVSDVNEPPVINGARIVAAESTSSGTVLQTLNASDPDGGSVTLQIIAGNESGAFDLDPDNGFLTLANTAPFSVAANPQFTLVVRATDDGTPPLSDTAEIRISPSSVLVTEGASARVRVPTSAAEDASWFARSFVDSAWTAGSTGVGYDTEGDYDPLIATDVETQMSEINASVYIRVPFNVADPSIYGALTLEMKYDDGFVAYLNGREVADRNAPGSPDWDSEATGGHNDDDAQIFQAIDITADLDALVAGNNVLAIHGMNTSTTSSDLLILPQLTATAAVPEPASISLNSATVIADTSATLRGSVDATGGDNPTLAFVWGRSDAGEDVAAWDHNMALGVRGAGSYNQAVTGLLPGRGYFFNLIASNAGGIATGGIAESFTTDLGDAITLIAEGAAASGFVPPNASPADQVWREPGFDDAAWESGTLAAGYETGNGYQGLIGNSLDFEAEMFETNATCYLRVPFAVANPSAIGRLTLRMKYDDGFVAWLNGIEIARRNAFPGDPIWNSGASADHPDAEATVFEDIDISEFVGLLAGGENILAIHGLNGGAASSDLLISPELLGYPTGTTSTPTQLYNDWAQTTHGLSVADALATADPERDGLINLLEYAFDSDPNATTSGVSPSPSVGADGKLRISFVRRTDAAERGLIDRVEASGDLTNWNPATIEAVEAIQPLPGGTTERVTVRLAAIDGDTLHARVAVELTL